MAKEQGPSKGEVEKDIANVIIKRTKGFKPEFRMLEVKAGQFIPVEVVGNNLIETRTTDQILNRLAGHFFARSGIIGKAPLKVLADGVAHWAKASTQLNPILEGDLVPFLWGNETSDKYTWHRLPFDYEAATDFSKFPLWLEIIGRIKEQDNKTAFLQFIGSLFVPDSDRQQFLWLYGNGENGKSAIGRALKYAFGAACNAALTPPPRDRELTFNASLHGKRIGVFADCNNEGYTTSDHFKRMTGGEDLPAKLLFKDEFQYTPNFKLVFTSNTRPDVSGLKADSRRSIICTFDDAPVKEWRAENPGLDYEQELFKEMGSFCSYARSRYTHDCGTGPIKVTHDSAQDYSSLREEEYEVFVEKHLELDSNSYIPRDVFQKMLNSEFDNRLERKRFRDWLLRNYPVSNQSLPKSVLARFNLDPGTKGYLGMKVKSSSSFEHLTIPANRMRVAVEPDRKDWTD